MVSSEYRVDGVFECEVCDGLEVWSCNHKFVSRHVVVTIEYRCFGVWVVCLCGR